MVPLGACCSTHAAWLAPPWACLHLLLALRHRPGPVGACAALTSLVVPSSNLLDDNMLSDMFSTPCQLERLSLAGCVRVHRVGPFMRQCSQMRALDLRCTGITDVDVALLVRHPHMLLQSGNKITRPQTSSLPHM